MLPNPTVFKPDEQEGKLSESEKLVRKRRKLPESDFQNVKLESILVKPPSVKKVIPEDKKSAQKYTTGHLGFKRRKPLNCMKTRNICRYFDRETYIKAHLTEMIIFIGFIVTMLILTNSSTSTEEYYFTKVVKGVFVNEQLEVRRGQRVRFVEINLMDMIWPYLEVVLVNNLYWKYWYYRNNTKAELTEDDANILYDNKLIGLPRIRQVRVKRDSCIVPELFKNKFNACYAEYSHDAEDKKPFGPGDSPAWVYNTEEELNTIEYKGQKSTYGGGGYYVDFNHTKEITIFNLIKLKNNLWIDRATRVILINFAIYNANINFFCFVQLVFELLPTGSVLPAYHIAVFKFIRHVNFWDYVQLVFQTIFVAFIVYYMFCHGYEIYYFGCFYFKSFFNWLDLLMLGLNIACVILFSYLYVYNHHNLKNLLDSYDSHPEFENVLVVQTYYVSMMNTLLLLCWFKLIKYFGVNQSLYQMQMTLSRAATDILNYSVIFFTVFFAFAQLGHLLFGCKVRDFRTLFSSVFALLRAIVGDFNYPAIEHACPYLGPIYFFAYIFFIFFLLVNMFLAIIIETYSKVRSELEGAGIPLHVSDVVGRLFNWFLRYAGFRKLADSRQLKAEEEVARAVFQDIRNLMSKCGFTELEIDLFFSKYDITEDKLIKPEEIRQLLSNLEHIPTKEQVQPKIAQEIDDHLHQLSGQVDVLDEAVTEANAKIDIILQKIDELQEQRISRIRRSNPDLE